MSLEWWCPECGSREPYESTGGEEYELGDKDPCPDCNFLAVLRVAGQSSGKGEPT